MRLHEIEGGSADAQRERQLRASAEFAGDKVPLLRAQANDPRSTWQVIAGDKIV